ncbi:MAG: N-6 DNA methylase [Pseudomonadota bacterium]
MHPSAYRPSEFSDPYGRYYTTEDVGLLLVASMSIERPRIVLDLGAGRGSLAIAAQRRWASARIIGVDSDPDAGGNLRGVDAGSYQHFRFDALAKDLPGSLGLKCGTVDAAVCNPPFIRPKWRSRYAELLEEVGFSGAFPAIQEAGADVLFLAQNLRLMRSAGQLGLIVPDGIVAGVRHRDLRRLLIERHKVELVVKLPRNAFRLADAQTYILILRKGNAKVTHVELRELTTDEGLSEPLFIKPEEAVQRLDYSYHRNTTLAGARYSNGHSAVVTLEQLGAHVCRGLLSSREARQSPLHVLHTTNFPTDTNLIVPLRERAAMRSRLLSKMVIAEPGDILLARVGRNLEKKICVVEDGRIVISDCIYRIRIDKRWKRRVLDALSSATGRQWIATAACGVGARQLSKVALLGFPVPLR